MSISHSRLSYSDCYEVMDQALEDERGARVKMVSLDEANFFRMRLHQARSIDRRENRQTYEPGHQMYGVSTYDKLTLRLRQLDGECFVYLEQNTVIPGALEKLSELDGVAKSTKEIDAEAQSQLVDHSPAPVVITVTPTRMIEGPMRRRV